jgi:methionyl-tRNA synthetase
LVTRTNQYIDRTAPFKLRKDPSKAAELDQILYTLADVCRMVASLIWPIVPGTSEKIRQQLGLTGPLPLLCDADQPLAEGQKIGEIFALFPRKDIPKKG